MIRFPVGSGFKTKGIRMEALHFRYVTMSHSQTEAGYVGIVFEGQGGTRFLADLSVADAQRLADDLSQQVRIAGKFPN
jgi:hypothetical protein